MLKKTYCCCVNGLRADLVSVEVRISRGIKYYMIGLAEQSVKESLHRVESALQTGGWRMPRQKIVINLAPTDIKKAGSHYDLAIAITILVVSGQIPDPDLEQFMFIGGLSLRGEVLCTKGLINMVIAAKRNGIKHVIVPEEQLSEALLVSDLEVIGVRNLEQVIKFLKEGVLPKPIQYPVLNKASAESSQDRELVDFADLKGQIQARRALEIAASGGHNVLMIGPPGSGKTLLSKMFVGILPLLKPEEAMETWQLYSLTGFTPPGGYFSAERPFRAPHHTIGYASLVGGGVSPAPGEISLAHHGVLFLDELPEFKRSVLEALRQPLESKQILISRARNKSVFPADFIFVGAMNPCPCGYHNHPVKTCVCSSHIIQKYISKISGPLLDRIDMHLEIMPVLPDEMVDYAVKESSLEILKRVDSCRELQFERHASERAFMLNAQLTARMIRKYCRLTPSASGLLHRASERMAFSARSHERIIRVSQTIADLENSSKIEIEHIAEALMYRCLDRKNWTEKI